MPRHETKKEVVVLVMMCLGEKEGLRDTQTQTEIIVIEECGVGTGFIGETFVNSQYLLKYVQLNAASYKSA